MLTSTQAAGLLEVHESSVKRWTNEGKLAPVKTDGGHRRISLHDLLEFARSKRSGSALLRLAPFEAELAQAALACRERNDFLPLADLIVKLCDTKPPGYLMDMLRYLESACGIPLPRIFDLGITQAMRRIGREWDAGTRSIAQEHRFTQKVLDALHGLRGPDADMRGDEVPLAVVGCAESCHHEIGAMFVRVILERIGWRVCYLGSNVPFAEYAGIQAELGARLVAISFVPPCSNPDARRCLAAMGGLYRNNRPYALALGGGALQPEGLETRNWPFQSLKIGREMEAFQAWAALQFRKKGSRAC